MMKLIFLDIDGVLNNELYFKSRNQSVIKNETREEYELSMFDPRCIELLNHVIDKTRAYVVISSSWRLGRELRDICYLFDKLRFTGRIIGMTPILRFSNSNDTVPRGCEIKSWIDAYEKEHKEQVSKYVILDDDSDMLYWQHENYFRVDGYSGLTQNLCYRVINYLNG